MNDNNPNVLQVKLNGFQRGATQAPPMVFDFEQQILSGGALPPELMTAVTSLFIKPMFESALSGPLFNINSLYPDELFTYVAMYNMLNKAINGEAISKNKPIRPIPDDLIKSKVESMGGLMTPHQIELKYSSVFRRPSI